MKHFKHVNRGVSVKATLQEITDFVKFCKADKNLAGFNLFVSKIPGKSYILGKVVGDPMPRYVLPIWLDVVDPLQRPIIMDTIHMAYYGKPMEPEKLEDEMICKTSEVTNDTFN